MCDITEVPTLLDDHWHSGDDCLVHKVIEILKELVSEELVEVMKVKDLTSGAD